MNFLANGRNVKKGLTNGAESVTMPPSKADTPLRTEERRKSVMKKLSAVMMMSMEMCMCRMCMFRRAQIGQLIFPDGMASC